MAKLNRVIAKVFGQTAGGGELGIFGSLAAGTPTTTTSPTTVQSLAAWLGGWFSAVVGENSPAIEDMNGFCFVMSYQIAYLMQTGVPEWTADTTYYIGSVVNNGSGVLYISTANDNLNNALTDATKWMKFQSESGIRTAVGAETASVFDNTVLCDPTGGSFNETLPAANIPTGKKLTFKNIATNGNTVTLVGTIDGNVNPVLNSYPIMDSMTIQWDGAAWYAI